MSILNDVRNIIKPININYASFDNDVDHILENIIMNNITIYNSYIFNHIIYNTNIELKDKVIKIITKYLGSYIKNQRIHFRNLNKKNKLDIKDFNNFFDDCYKLINKLNSMFQHIINCKNNIIKKYGTNKWGDSILWNILIEHIYNILLNDVVFKYAIVNNIKNISSNEKNHEMFRLYNYMNTFSLYLKHDNNYINILDESIVDIIENNINNISLVDSNILNIYKFKKIYKYYFDYYVNYYYICKEHVFIKLNNYITNFIKNIFEINNYIFIKNFINIYKKEIISLIKHIDIINIILNYPIVNINDFISYYNNIYNISKETYNDILYGIINECIKQNTKTYFKTFEDVLYLADLINTDIINKDVNEFYYLLGSYCNKDDFIMAICQKYMERIIYTYCDNSIETSHYDILIKFFKSDKNLTLKYETIANDYNNSIKLWNSMYESQNNFKLIITSLDAWKINHSIGYSDTIINTEQFTTILCNKMFQYNNMNIANIQKKLIMYPHLGCVDIEIYNKKLLVLPAHMFCLELFISSDTHLNYDFIFNKVKENMSNYTDEFIKSIIDSLIGPVLIKTTDNILYINNNINNINNINMIELFNNNIKQDIIDEMKEELCHNKIDIIKANINHFIKLVEEISLDNLYDLISKNIKIFNINRKMFDDAINSLYINEYIEYNKLNNIRKMV